MYDFSEQIETSCTDEILKIEWDKEIRRRENI